MLNLESRIPTWVSYSYVAWILHRLNIILGIVLALADSLVNLFAIVSIRPFNP